jgi:virulence factor Mce-like protein
MRARGGSIAGNPVLIGATTVLVVIVAVFLSYNANQGLPFVPSYTLNAQMPSAANLVRGNDVRIGGVRVGSVDTIEVERRDDGTSFAVLGLKLEEDVAPLPKDSTVLIRPRSALGLKYVEIARGSSDEGFADGDTIPIASAKPAPVEFDEFLGMFDDDTRAASQDNLRGFGDAFAVRGESINLAIGALRPLLRDVIPVAQNLSSEQTKLSRFVRELADAARIVAPAAESQAQLFVNLDRTFAALRDVQERWDAIGKVPRERVREFAGRLKEVEDRVRAAVDRRWQAVDPETEARVAQFRSRVEGYEAQAAKAHAAGDHRRAKEAERQAAQWREWLAAAEQATR